MTDIEKYLSTAASCGDAINCGVKSTVRFIEVLCLPAAGEFGLLLRDKVLIWRLNNIVSIVEKTKKIIHEIDSAKSKHAHPRIVIKVIQEGSCVDDSNLQEMWAGLLASSCTEDGTDETNLIFVNVLAQLSSSQAKIIKLPFIEGNYKAYQHDKTEYTDVEKERSGLIEYTGLPNWGVLKRELDHLGSLGLVSYHLRSNPRRTLVSIHYEEAALWLYARCQGHTGSLQQFISAFINPL